MNIEGIRQTLEEFKDNATGIQGVVLVYKDGELITNPPIGNWDQKNVGVIAGVMAQLAQHIDKQLKWKKTEEIYVETEGGYIIRLACPLDTFLLVKASKDTNRGTLKAQISVILEKLQSEIQAKSPTKDKLGPGR
ncbi:MAG: hypothetical protein F6K16_28325 [Symploca sp. SIO2B6]|nr:hypothetical protein [Symploca sp. SIO2B6]